MRKAQRKTTNTRRQVSQAIEKRREELLKKADEAFARGIRQTKRLVPRKVMEENYKMSVLGLSSKTKKSILFSF